MNSQKTANDLVYLLYKCFLYYNNKFYKITSGAKERFEKKQWALQQKSVSDRYILHSKTTEKIINHFTGFDFKNMDLDFALKILFMFKAKTKNYPNPEIPYSFCLSVLRTLHPFELPYTLWEGGLKGMGKYPKDPNIKYVYGNDDISNSFKLLIQDIELKPCVVGLELSLVQINKILSEAIPNLHSRIGISYYRELFYRNQHGYLIGYIDFNSKIIPFAMAFENDSIGIRLDALITEEETIKNIFSFSRSYLQINSANTAALAEYISKILPSKHIGQLYINLGYHEYGREMLLLELYGHANKSDFQFITKESPSKSGFVKFSNPKLNYDLKVVSRKEIESMGISLENFVEYNKNVILLDRVGRIPDSQYFEKINLPIASFDQEALENLLENALSNIILNTDKIEINHLFLERKSTNFLSKLESCDNPLEIKELLLDLGNCIKELALTGLLIENIAAEDFGVSIEGKVVFKRLYKIKKLTNYDFITSITKSGIKTNETPSTSIVLESYLDQIFEKKKYKKEFFSLNKELFKPKFWNTSKKSNKGNSFIDLKPYQSNIFLPQIGVGK